MACFHPIPARQEYAGPGKTRMKLHEKREPTHWLPCGICIGCQEMNAQMWALRLQHEARFHNSNLFLNVTYDDDNAPDALQKRHLQLFLKVIRRHTTNQIKHFSCGEYGDRTQRPHYHVALFGREPFGDEKRWDSEQYESKTLNGLWQKGRVTISPLTPNRMSYVAGYVLKKAGYKQQVYINEAGNEIQKPFRLMSKGIGKQWIDTFAEDLRHGHVDNIDYKCGIPRYYNDRIKATRPTLHERIERAKGIRRSTLPDPDPARNKAAEYIREQQIKQRRRDKI